MIKKLLRFIFCRYGYHKPGLIKDVRAVVWATRCERCGVPLYKDRHWIQGDDRWYAGSFK
jgi:hypothetical protein